MYGTNSAGTFFDFDPGDFRMLCACVTRESGERDSTRNRAISIEVRLSKSNLGPPRIGGRAQPFLSVERKS